MAYTVNHEIAKDGLRLPYIAGAGITYSDTGSSAYRGKAVTQSASATAVLTSDGDKVLGAIELVESPDPVGTKMTVHLAGVVTFINSEGADPVTPGAAIVGAADGDVRDAASDGSEDDVARGIVTQVVGNKVHVLF